MREVKSIFLSLLISMILYWIYKTRIKQSKINLRLFYLSIASIIFVISFISSTFTCFITDIANYHFCPLSYPLELTAYLSPLFIYPPLMTLRLNIFGIEIAKIFPVFGTQLGRHAIVFIEGWTMFFTSIIFLMNITFVLFCLLILHIAAKGGNDKDAYVDLRGG